MGTNVETLRCMMDNRGSKNAASVLKRRPGEGTGRPAWGWFATASDGGSEFLPRETRGRDPVCCDQVRPVRRSSTKQPRTSQVGEPFPLRTYLFKGVSEHGEAGGVEVAAGQLSFLISSPGQFREQPLVPDQP